MLPASASFASNRATGDWGGARTRLADAGVEIELDYTAESFSRDDAEKISYLGNIDFLVTFDTEKLGAWRGGQVFFYAQSNHSTNISDSLALIMPVSNLDAGSFTQISEFWLEQQVGDRVVLRLGKQDANRDFASPRFAGNFVNSSFGVLPGAPMPSFPAPAMGAAVLFDPVPWLGVRAGAYEGNPTVESFGETAFGDDSGLFAIGELLLRHDVRRHEGGIVSIGGWTHTNSDRSGLYGVYDLLFPWDPGDSEDTRSFQVFARVNWSPDDEDDVGLYAGGGITAHGFLGRNNTIGIGTGYVRSHVGDEAFVELFFKWRAFAWLSVEPDVQVYDTASSNPVYFGVRLRLKL